MLCHNTDLARDVVAVAAASQVLVRVAPTRLAVVADCQRIACKNILYVGATCKYLLKMERKYCTVRTVVSIGAALAVRALVAVGAGVAAILLGGEGVLVVVDGGHGAGGAAEVCHDVGTEDRRCKDVT